MSFKPTNKVVYGAPVCLSLIFNAEGKCTCYTGGYVMDRRLGNTQGLGAMFGVIAAIGGPVLKPGSLIYTLLSLPGTVGSVLYGLFNVVTLGLFFKPMVSSKVH
ncbi:hypothetical protein CEUSTIGMA_g6955.t1 [Chlamydomonas eustigma]|uniref:Uncharacterized protein n=1 Tax=Chlamydomonas eustigma TaxID=1157962 RepID=A0A250X8W4_9CHLO|nr:hypothetical protein CEUSTIGMA_g6955.t1 [Chlamydomonas eustigma]|eukprot:GAX79514.1 hypothetical protein CEUSTIGMA_g6955.t1 [Chlamydomonas eustigma]